MVHATATQGRHEGRKIVSKRLICSKKAKCCRQIPVMDDVSGEAFGVYIKAIAEDVEALVLYLPVFSDLCL